MTILTLDGSTLRCGARIRPFTDADRAALTGLTARWRKLPRGNPTGRVPLGKELWTWLGDFAPPPDAPFEVRTTDATMLDTPWEILHDGTDFFVSGRHGVHRRIGAAASPRPTSPGRLTVVFMAASPEGQRRLDFEAEERAVLDAVGLSVDLFVEETGSRAGLHRRLRRAISGGPGVPGGPVDVLHLTCHGTASPTTLALEDEVGHLDRTPAKDLADKLTDLPDVGLCVVSACETAADGLAHAFVTTLVREQAPAALGWALPVSDREATVFAADLFRALAEGQPVPTAVHLARKALRTAHPDGDWSQARLVLGPRGGGSLATPDGLRRLPPAQDSVFLDDVRRKVKVAGPDVFVGRRRALQAALAALDARKVVLITGLGHQGKSSLAARVVRRRESWRPVVCYGRDDLHAAGILAALARAFDRSSDPDWAARVQRVADTPGLLASELVAVLPKLDVEPLFVLDDLEQVLDLDTNPPRVAVEAVRVALRGLWGAVTRTGRARLLFTSRVRPVLPDDRGQDLMAGAAEVSLGGLSPVERRLLPVLRQAVQDERLSEPRAAAVERASEGNPGLIDQLLRLAEAVERGELAEASFGAALTALATARDSGQAALDGWVAEVVTTLVGKLTAAQRALLAASSVLPSAAPADVVRTAWLDAVGATPADAARLEALGLWVAEPDAEDPTKRALAPAPLAVRHTPLDPALGPLMAQAVLPGLLARWEGGLERPATARALTEVGLLARDEAVVRAHAAGALWALTSRKQMREALPLARRVLELVQGPLDLDLCRFATDAVASDNPEEALAVLARGPDGAGVAMRQADLLRQLGRPSEAAIAVAAALAAASDPRDRALLLGRQADLLQVEGHLKEALRILNDEMLPVFHRLGDVRECALTRSRVADIIETQGDPDEAHGIRTIELMPAFERVGDVRASAIISGKIADTLQARGQLDEAIETRENLRPVFDCLGDIREAAVNLAKLARMLATRGQLDEAENMLRRDVLPVFLSLGDVGSEAVTLQDIADILQGRGQLEEPLHIHANQALPIYRRLKDTRSQAITLGKVAEITALKGDVDEALRILIDELLPVFEQMCDVRGRAVTFGRIADLYAGRGDLEEAIRLYTNEFLPIFQRLGEARESLVGRFNLALLLAQRGHQADVPAVIEHFVEALRAARQYGFPVEERQLVEMMTHIGFPPTLIDNIR